MNLHKHARLTLRGRALLVHRIHQGLRVEEAAQAAGVSVRTAYKWLKRFREEGECLAWWIVRHVHTLALTPCHLRPLGN